VSGRDQIGGVADHNQVRLHPATVTVMRAGAGSLSLRGLGQSIVIGVAP